MMSDNEKTSLIKIRAKFSLTNPLLCEVPVDLDIEKVKEQGYQPDGVKLVRWGRGWVELEISDSIFIEEILEKEGWFKDVR